MGLFFAMFAVALVFSGMGFKKYVWFISIGYRCAIAAIGVALLIVFHNQLTVATTCACVLLVVYGLRLGGYLIFRELRSSSYNKKMETEIKSGNDVPMVAKIGIWVSAALLYACEAAPVIFRLGNGSGSDALLVVGLLIAVTGLVVEFVADMQKSATKKINPGRFVDTGLYRIVRCPNYFGEMLFWTGIFVGGISIYAGVLQWVAALVGYLGIIYVMFGGARRLEIRQNRTYGNNPDYQRYVKTTPIMIPLVPLYSVEKHKWLVA